MTTKQKTAIAEVESSNKRKLTGTWRIIFFFLTCAGIALAIIQIFFIMDFFGTVFIDTSFYYGIFAAFLSPVFLLFSAGKRFNTNKIPFYDILFFLIVLGICIFYAINGEEIFIKGWSYIAPFGPMVMSIVLAVLIIEAVRRTSGTVLAALCGFFLFFPSFASYIPAPFTGFRFSIIQTFTIQIMGREALTGIPISVFSYLLIGFMIFGIAMTTTGGAGFFINLSNALLGSRRGGPAKVSVMASGFFGSISGSVVSNVLTTGAFTIPAMKKTGYPPHYAAAVETNASSGGMLLPPVMGSAAFIMARWLGIPYVEICAMAAIPSVLYFFTVMMQTDAYAARKGLKGLAKELIPSLKETMKTGWFYGFAFAILVFFLAYLRLEGQAPFYAILMLLVLAMIRKETRLKWRDIGKLIEGSGKILVQLVALFAGISMIVGALSYTGVATTVAGEIIRIAGGNIALILIFSAIVALILGTGMQGASVYILLALMLAPALTGLGFNVAAVHLFLMYFAMLSFITPPVAMGAFAAAGLAGCSPVKASIMAMRLGTVTYFLPFFFLFNPAMIALGSALDIFWVTSTAVIGIIIVSGSLEGYMWGIGEMRWPLRIPYALAGLLLIVPNGTVDMYGGIVLIVAVAIHLFWKKVFRKTPNYAT